MSNNTGPGLILKCFTRIDELFFSGMAFAFLFIKMFYQKPSIEEARHVNLCNQTV